MWYTPIQRSATRWYGDTVIPWYRDTFTFHMLSFVLSLIVYCNRHCCLEHQTFRHTLQSQLLVHGILTSLTALSIQTRSESAALFILVLTLFASLKLITHHHTVFLSQFLPHSLGFPTFDTCSRFYHILLGFTVRNSNSQMDRSALSYRWVMGVREAANKI